jgi:hypothetical protein
MANSSGWEYCLVSEVPTGMVVYVTYFYVDGIKRTEHRTRDYTELTALKPRIIAELGLAGWELVSVDMGALYFKRPLTVAQVSETKKADDLS